jgi:hypothetical protein
MNQIDVDHNIFKRRMDEHGKPLDTNEGKKEGESSDKSLCSFVFETFQIELFKDFSEML